MLMNQTRVGYEETNALQETSLAIGAGIRRGNESGPMYSRERSPLKLHEYVQVASKRLTDQNGERGPPDIRETRPSNDIIRASAAMARPAQFGESTKGRSTAESQRACVSWYRTS